MNPSGPGLFLCGRLLLAASTSELFIGLFIVSASSWFRLGRTQVSRNLPFLPCLQVYVHRFVCNILWWWFEFLWSLWWFPLYCFLLHLFGCSLFSFLSVWLVVCLFRWSFQKNRLLDLLIFWGVFRVSVSFSSALILVISCLLLGFEFFWSFFNHEGALY